MAEMRNFEAEAAEFVRRGEHRIGRLFHREPAPGADPYPQAPAQPPATVAAAPAPVQAQQEETMSLTTIEAGIKTDITEGVTWVKEWAARIEAAAPGIIATSDAVAGSTVGQLAEIFLGKILPPDLEAEFLTLARRYASLGRPAVTDPAPTGQQPVQAPAQ